jgi:cold shock protein
MTGTIKTLRTEKGFGFIKDGAKEYFFHHTAVVGERMEDLREGDSVDFDLGADGPKGPRAENVRRTST